MILVATFVSTLRILPIAAAVLCLLALSTSLSVAGSLVEPLRRYQGEPVTVHVWGEALPAQSTAGGLLSVRAIGAGLHLFVQSDTGLSTHLKIAQPRHVHIGTDGVTINEASYVQCAGKKLRRASGWPAVTIVVVVAGTAF